MSTVAIILIAVGALVILALIVAAIRSKTRERRYQERREAAHLHRAEADERAHAAMTESEAAEAHLEHAERLDPDREETEGEPRRA
jgi:FtsZ-interacting cell division protein ZipA